MKGDLSTLKKVCRYASTVMLIGTAVFVVLAAATLILGIGSFFSGGMKDTLCSWVGTGSGAETLVIVSAMLQMLVIYGMGAFTVSIVYRIMSTIMESYTPFTDENSKRIKKISMLFLFSSAVLLVLGCLAHRNLTEILFMFFGCLLVAVVMYCLTIVCRYGVLLQNESDHTL